MRTTWSANLKAGKCGRCGKRKPVKGSTRCKPCRAAVNAAVQTWAEKHPEAAQANKNAYWKTRKGKAFIKARRKKFNLYRKEWRQRKKLSHPT